MQRVDLPDKSYLAVEAEGFFLYTPLGDRWRELTRADVRAEVAQSNLAQLRDVVLVAVGALRVEVIHIMDARNNRVDYIVPSDNNRWQHTPFDQMVVEGNHHFPDRITERDYLWFIDPRPVKASQPSSA